MTIYCNLFLNMRGVGVTKVLIKFQIKNVFLILNDQHLLKILFGKSENIIIWKISADILIAEPISYF